MKKVPQLRFPEFSEEWEERELGEIIALSKGKHNPKKETKNYRCVELEHLSQGTGVLLGFVDSVEQNSIKNKFIDGEVLYGKLRPYLRKFWKANFDGVCSTEIWVLKGKLVTNDFVHTLIQSEKFDLAANVSSGSKMPRADWDYISEIPFFFPEKREQQKIADFFTLLDQKIEKQQQKIEHLERYKKGIMQQLFSRTIRFKDENGNDYQDWDEFVLGELGETFTGLSGKTKDDFGHGTAKFITYMNVFKNISASEKLTESVDVEISENQNHVIKGDILFTTSSETPTEVGMASVWMHDLANMYLNSFCFGFRTNVKIVNTVFLTYQLRSQKIRKKISILGQGSTRYNISKTELMKMSVQIPCLEEQEKIVSIISEQVVKVEKEVDKFNKLVSLKRGLMQKLFV